MPIYEDEELKRRAQVGMLREPVSTTMPVGGAPSIIPEPAQRQAPSAGNRHRPAMPGWDAGNWADPNMHSVKYDAGDLLYGLTKPSEVGRRVQSPEFQQRFPGATFNGKDWIDFQGALSDGDSGVPVYGIDYLKGANPETDTSEGAWWGAPEAAAVAGGGAPSAMSTPMGALNPALDSSALARIMAELNATAKDEQSPAEREAILQMLQGGL